jgi:hypothetical protein
MAGSRAWRAPLPSLASSGTSSLCFARAADHRRGLARASLLSERRPEIGSAWRWASSGRGVGMVLRRIAPGVAGLVLASPAQWCPRSWRAAAVSRHRSARLRGSPLLLVAWRRWPVWSQPAVPVNRSSLRTLGPPALWFDRPAGCACPQVIPSVAACHGPPRHRQASEADHPSSPGHHDPERRSGHHPGQDRAWPAAAGQPRPNSSSARPGPSHLAVI